MLLLDKVEKMGRIGASDKVEGPNLQRTGEPVDNIDCLLAADGLFQQFPGVIDASGCYEVLSHHEVLKFLKDGVLKIGFDCFQPRDLEGQGFYFIFSQMLENFGRNLGTERHEKNRGFLPAGKRLDVLGFFRAGRRRGFIFRR